MGPEQLKESRKDNAYARKLLESVLELYPEYNGDDVYIEWHELNGWGATDTCTEGHLHIAITNGADVGDDLARGVIAHELSEIMLERERDIAEKVRAFPLLGELLYPLLRYGIEILTDRDVKKRVVGAYGDSIGYFFSDSNSRSGPVRVPYYKNYRLPWHEENLKSWLKSPSDLVGFYKFAVDSYTDERWVKILTGKLRPII